MRSRPTTAAAALAFAAVTLAACGQASSSSLADPAGGATTQADTTAQADTTGDTTDAAAGDTAAADAPDSSQLENFGPAPDLVGIDGWLQNDGITSLDDVAGKVTVVQFWTYTCINCKRTFPNMKALAETHKNDNFQIIGVHAPEFEVEKDPANVTAALADLGLTWPIALDTDHESFASWQGRRAFWPRTYVLDQNGDIRFDRIGEGAYDQLNQTVATLLADPAA